MESKSYHTPGPWRIVTDGISHWIEIVPNKISMVWAKEADRNLIVAAPDLLETLQVIARQKLGEEDEAAAILKAIIKIARAAIAKTTG